MRTLIVIPTYNEAENIGPLIERILVLQPGAEILVVDDGSADGTDRVVESLARRSERVALLRRPRKEGLGRAYVDGFRHGLSRQPPYERFVQMDADLSHAPESIAALLAACGDGGVSVGSRYVPGGTIAEWSFSRRALSCLGNLYVRFLLGRVVRDWTSGFRCFSREVLERIGLDTVGSRGYLFQIEMISRCAGLGCPVSEVPIRFVDRAAGRTKLGALELCEAAAGVPLILLKGLKKRRPDARA